MGCSQRRERVKNVRIEEDESKEDFLNQILEPLEICLDMRCVENVRLGQSVLDAFFFAMEFGLRKTDGSYEMVMCLEDGGAFYSFPSLDFLEEHLFKNVKSFCAWKEEGARGWAWKDNPYLGCRSLEEAKIRRDLLETEKDTDS